MSVSLQEVTKCIGISTSGSVSVLKDIFGFCSGRVPRDSCSDELGEVSILRQIRALRGPHIHLNLVRVGADYYDDQQFKRIDFAVYRARQIYEQRGIGIGRVEHYDITRAQARGRDFIGYNEIPWLFRTFTVKNDGVDVFVVRSIVNSNRFGRSIVCGPGKKGGSWDGVLGGEVERKATGLSRTFAHEIGHHLCLEHVGDASRLMAQTWRVEQSGIGYCRAVQLTVAEGNRIRKHPYVQTGCTFRDNRPAGMTGSGKVQGHRRVPLGPGMPEPSLSEDELVETIKKAELGPDLIAAMKELARRRSNAAMLAADLALKAFPKEDTVFLSAVTLWSELEPKESQEVLLRALDLCQTPRQIEIVADRLSYVGDAVALANLERVAKEATISGAENKDVQNQIEFACTLISYRLGLNVHLFDSGSVNPPQLRDTHVRELPFVVPSAKRISAIENSICPNLHGVLFWADRSLVSKCNGQEYVLIPNRSFFEQGASSNFDCNGILAGVLYRDDCSETYEIAELILAHPDRSNAGMKLVGVSLGGEICRVGDAAFQVHGDPSDNFLDFVLQGVAPIIAPFGKYRGTCNLNSGAIVFETAMIDETYEREFSNAIAPNKANCS